MAKKILFVRKKKAKPVVEKKIKNGKGETDVK
jgi:hypothetical protein